MSGHVRSRNRGSATSDFITFIAVSMLSFVIGSLTLVPWIYGVAPAWLTKPWSIATRIESSLYGGEWPSLPRWLTKSGGKREVTSRQTYVVQPGDSLSEIAGERGIPLAALIERNGLVDPDILTVGQVLVIAEGHVDAAGPSVQSASSDVAAVGQPEVGSLENQSGDGFAGILRGGAVELYRLIRDAPIESGHTPTGESTTVDALLALAQEQLRGARFEEALETVRVAVRLLEAEQESSEVNLRRAAFELVRAEAHLAFGDALPADQSFQRALDADPDLVLDQDTTSPKVLRSFARVRAQPR